MTDLPLARPTPQQPLPCAGQHTAPQQMQDATRIVAAALHPHAVPGAEHRDWRDRSTRQLIEHLLTRFHQRHRQQLPELIRMAQRVEQTHADRSDCPHALTAHLQVMEHDLESHLQKEEKVLFPMMLSGIPASQVPAPIGVMLTEHDNHGHALARLAELTNDLKLPDDACTTWRLLYDGLEELRADLLQHIHLENDVLFAGLTRFD